MTPSPATSSAPLQAGDPAVYEEVVRAALHGLDADDWTLSPSPLWWYVSRPTAVLREQGWKIHVPATPLSAPTVLSRVAGVLVGERVPFKFARTPRLLTDLVAMDQERGSGGKFVTVYPADDEQFRRLAAALHRATAGLAGPSILSDLPYLPGSLVHYRYGVFRGTGRLTVDGTVEPMLRAPDGGLVRDRRQARFAPPAWAVPPLPYPAPASGPSPAPGRPAAVLLGDRYEVRSALRHSYRGGVYLATDRVTGQDVVVKEARSHVGATLTGTDATDLLRHEAAVHARLAGSGIAPEAHGLLTQGGHHYLVQERVPGRTLRRWTAEHLDAGRTPPTDTVGELARVVAQVHRLGLVLRDLSPDNVMVTPDGEVRLIDLEAVTEPGAEVRTVRTPGYSAPETPGGGAVGPAPGPEADFYSLGAVLLHVLTGADPVFAPDRPALRGHDERLALLVDSVLPDGPETRSHRQAVLAMTAEDPAARWGPDRLRAHLVRPRPVPRAAAAPAPVPAATDRILDDGLTWLLDNMAPAGQERLWPAGPSGERTDPLNVQHGAAGVLGVLAEAGRHSTDPRLHAGVAQAARWITARTAGPDPHLPGLYFGRSGTAWALLDAARLLDDEALTGHAVRLARAVPVRWPNPDVCHGVAGAGLTQLHFWQVTGEPGFRVRAVAAAEHLLAAAVPGHAGTVWPVPRGFDSDLAGIAHYGFGHGAAGIGTFLLLAGLAAGRDDFVAAAQQAGATLLAAGRLQEGAAGWAADDRRPDAPTHAPHWCSGASGIGTFLIRLWRAGGDPRHREAAEAAAVAVHRGRHRASPAACHGLAGDAQFLLDLADALDEPRYRRHAHELVACVHARHVLHEDLMLVPDETLTGVSAAFNTGLAGVLGLMVRLRHGGARPWLPTGESRPARREVIRHDD
ncbi:class IV lanthionine synthetase LanL [Streptomyces sp. NPDC001380]|uniref:class IV lanthionine synthetase LanL n=1 Tax=Streptomyces sp. NPDC001380 TaxID=3364566 RepID=UPI0036CD0FFA